jgi:hypothetical protein
MGKSSGGGGGDSTTTVRYAGYIEDAHKDLITLAATNRADIIDSSPYGNYTVTDPDGAFFGAGYVISDFPSVYDMFGKFMAGLDIELLWNQEHSDSAYGTVVSEIVSADSSLLDDEVDSQVSQMKAGMRDIGSVMSTGFMVTEGNMRSDKVKAIAKEQADLRGRFAEIGQRRWEKHLDWNASIVKTQATLTQVYLDSYNKYVDASSTLDVRDLMWPFEVLNADMAIVGALQGAMNTKQKQEQGAAGTVSGILGTVAAIAQIVSLF